MASPRADDARACRALLSNGSRSFAWAGQLLGATLLDDCAALYAFCRQADDAVDEASDTQGAYEQLHTRLQRLTQASAAHALGCPIDRALHRAMARHGASWAPLFFLLEGFLWDAQHRTYWRLRDTLEYAARVAGSVGVVLAQLCGARSPCVLARAADLGLAMQLTNIARDVGEDARRGRVYLPGQWLQAGGLCATDWLAQPVAHPAIAAATHRLLRLADGYYARARLGLHALPWRARLAMACAARLYQAIGQRLRRRRLNNVQQRSVVHPGHKVLLCLRACVQDGHAPHRKTSQQRLARSVSPPMRPLWASMQWPIDSPGAVS